MPLPSIPAQLPKTQADWQQFINVMQAWQQSLTTLVWNAPTLGANIANYGSGWAPAGYAKDATGRVHLRGLIGGSGITLGATLFTLPIGYRPVADEMLAVCGAQTTNTFCRVDVYASGVVLVDQDEGVVNPTGYLSLSGISFQTY